jgi:hypothetical protein
MPVSMALPGLVIAVAMIGDALIMWCCRSYHREFGLSFAMVGVLLSLNRWIRLWPTPPSPISARGSGHMR